MARPRPPQATFADLARLPGDAREARAEPFDTVELAVDALFGAEQAE